MTNAELSDKLVELAEFVYANWGHQPVTDKIAITMLLAATRLNEKEQNNG